MHNVLYIGGFKLPDKNAAAHRVLSNSKIFVELGYKVVLLGLSDDMVKNEKVRALHSHIPNIHMFELPYPTNGIAWFKQLFDPSLIVQFIEKFKPKYLVLYNYPAFTHLLLLGTIKKYKIKVIADCTEWYGLDEGNLIKKVVKNADTFLRMYYTNRITNGLICISRFLEEFYKDRKTILLPPLVDTEEDRFISLHREIEEHTINFIYAGQMGKKDKINDVLRILSDLRKEGFLKFRFNVVGITEKDFIENNFVNYNYEFVSFHGRLSHSLVLAKVAASDFVIFIRENNRVNNAGFPTKLVEAISCGTPVITNKTSNITDYIVESKNGYLLEEDVEKISNKLKKILFLSKNEIEMLKQNCLQNNPFYYKDYILNFKKFLKEIDG